MDYLEHIQTSVSISTGIVPLIHVVKIKSKIKSESACVVFKISGELYYLPMELRSRGLGEMG